MRTRVLLFLAAAPLAACERVGGVGAQPEASPANRYRATATVLESADHGPELCLAVALDARPPA
jgi:hypothetical protein